MPQPAHKEVPLPTNNDRSAIDFARRCANQHHLIAPIGRAEDATLDIRSISSKIMESNSFIICSQVYTGWSCRILIPWPFTRMTMQAEVLCVDGTFHVHVYDHCVLRMVQGLKGAHIFPIVLHDENEEPAEYERVLNRWHLIQH